MVCFIAQSMRLVADEGDDHAVEIKEEHDQVETKLDKGFLITKKSEVSMRSGKENTTIFRRTFLWTFNFRKISVASRRCWFSRIL